MRNALSHCWQLPGRDSLHCACSPAGPGLQCSGMRSAQCQELGRTLNSNSSLTFTGCKASPSQGTARSQGS